MLEFAQVLAQHQITTLRQTSGSCTSVRPKSRSPCPRCDEITTVQRVPDQDLTLAVCVDAKRQFPIACEPILPVPTMPGADGERRRRADIELWQQRFANTKAQRGRSKSYSIAISASRSRDPARGWDGREEPP